MHSPEFLQDTSFKIGGCGVFRLRSKLVAWSTTCMRDVRHVIVLVAA